MLRVAGRRCVVIGGGRVAARRARALLDAGAAVSVIAPRVSNEIEALDVVVTRRRYERQDLEDAMLVVVATDDPGVNQAVGDEARAAGVLVNRADEPAAGDFTVPAHARHGPVTLAVHTGGASAAAAAAIRRELSAALDPDWPRLLETVAPFRAAVQALKLEADARRGRLERLVSTEAMRTLKAEGRDAFRRYCERVAAGMEPAPAGATAAPP
jgi:precorrin-2 dehydrogenase/sirohydrochlorin ferrochelatase